MISKKLVSVAIATFIIFIITGCAHKPKPINPFKTDTLYVFINENHKDKQKLVKLFKEDYVKPLDDFNMKVVLVDSKENLPSHGILLEIANFKTGYYTFFSGFKKRLKVDYTITSLDKNALLARRDLGTSSRFGGFESIVEDITEASKIFIERHFNKEYIDPRRVPKMINGECVENCRNVL